MDNCHAVSDVTLRNRCYISMDKLSFTAIANGQATINVDVATAPLGPAITLARSAPSLSDADHQMVVICCPTEAFLYFYLFLPAWSKVLMAPLCWHN